jgi:hypothetical protein
METKLAKTPTVNGLAPKETTLPTLAELFDDPTLAGKTESLNVILNANPPEKWVKQHPYIKDHKYLPIDKVEYLLRKIFKDYTIKITNQGTAFNGVWVTVRVKYKNPVDGKSKYHDGIGAMQLQTSAGKSPADLANINNGALSMAFPIAKTLAVKDACDHIGNIFGANLNRKDTVAFQPDMDLINKYKKALE